MFPTKIVASRLSDYDLFPLVSAENLPIFLSFVASFLCIRLSELSGSKVLCKSTTCSVGDYFTS